MNPSRETIRRSEPTSSRFPSKMDVVSTSHGKFINNIYVSEWGSGVEGWQWCGVTHMFALLDDLTCWYMLSRNAGVYWRTSALLALPTTPVTACWMETWASTCAARDTSAVRAFSLDKWGNRNVLNFVLQSSLVVALVRYDCRTDNSVLYRTALYFDVLWYTVRLCCTLLMLFSMRLIRSLYVIVCCRVKHVHLSYGRDGSVWPSPRPLRQPTHSVEQLLWVNTTHTLLMSLELNTNCLYSFSFLYYGSANVVLCVRHPIYFHERIEALG